MEFELADRWMDTRRYAGGLRGGLPVRRPRKLIQSGKKHEPGLLPRWEWNDAAAVLGRRRGTGPSNGL